MPYDKKFQNFPIQLLLIETHFSKIPNQWKVLKWKGLATTEGFQWCLLILAIAFKSNSVYWGQTDINCTCLTSENPLLVLESTI